MCPGGSLGDAEVGESNMVVATDNDVAGLDVSMDESLCMGVCMGVVQG